MKRILNTICAVLLLVLAISAAACSKKADDQNTCKTCKALGAGPDQQTIQKEVCTPEEEQAFRNANASREITCN